MAVTKKSKMRKAPSRKMKSKARRHDNIDVKTIEDIAKLTSHIKSNQVTLVLIYADWCGHCGTYKEGVWNKLANMPNRKVGMAQINEKILPQTPFSGLKFKGYPSTALVGKDMVPATMKDESGEETNALSNSNDFETMKKIVSSNPRSIVSSYGSKKISSNEQKSVKLTRNAESHRENEGMNAVEELDNISPDESTVVHNPPSVEDDIMSIQQKEPVKKKALGGSLYLSLVEAAKDVAAPAALTALAMTRSKRRKGTRRSKPKKVKAQ
jgi:thiol-disulfide isomerase/thioredoxin